MLCIIILWVLLFSANADLGAKNSDNYGYYVVEWEKFEKCKGPKLKDDTIIDNKLYINEDKHYIGELNISFLIDTKIDEIKIYVYTLKDNTKKLLWNYNFNKPCQHYVFAALIEQHLGAKNCVAPKGTYYTNMNLSAIMAKYIGKQFFYGDYLFKVVTNSKKGNIVCLYFDPKFKKKL